MTKSKGIKFFLSPYDIPTIATILGGSIVLVLSSFELIPDRHLDKYMLSLIILISTSLLVKGTGKLNELIDRGIKTEERTGRILDNIGKESRIFDDPNTHYAFLTERISNAKIQINTANFRPFMPIESNSRREYNKEMEKCLEKKGT